MFESNGIQMSKTEIQYFFDLCKANSKGYLSFQEFKKLYNNQDADDLFRYFIKRARQINSELHGEGVDAVYLPFNLSRLLEHMTLKQRRDTVVGRIEADWLNNDKVLETIKNFVKLFIINQGSIDTISNDEWSRKINAAIIRSEHKTRIAQGEKIRMKDKVADFYDKPSKEETQENCNCLKRLDSYHLNQLTAKVFESPVKTGRTTSVSPQKCSAAVNDNNI